MGQPLNLIHEYSTFTGKTGNRETPSPSHHITLQEGVWDTLNKEASNLPAYSLEIRMEFPFCISCFITEDMVLKTGNLLWPVTFKVLALSFGFLWIPHRSRQLPCLQSYPPKPSCRVKISKGFKQLQEMQDSSSWASSVFHSFHIHLDLTKSCLSVRSADSLLAVLWCRIGSEEHSASLCFAL